MSLQAALLPDRGIVKVSGDDSRSFLNGLFTIDVGKMTPGTARFGALLTPQGKIIVDFIVFEPTAEDGSGFLIDCPRALAETLVERLKFYKLRAKVAIEDLSNVLGVMAVWGGQPSDSEYGPSFTDPRLPALGTRVILPPDVAAEAATDLGAMPADSEAYEAHRIALGVPRGGMDFSYGDTFPHEADMDQLGGVDFDKGCYVGQEVVSRVEHRGTARSRIVTITYDDAAPDDGVPVTAGDKQLGMVGSAAGGRALALLRLDRLGDAITAGTPIEAGGIKVRAMKPAWAKFSFPGDTT
jgi:folate-binding protein YgfZ